MYIYDTIAIQNVIFRYSCYFKVNDKVSLTLIFGEEKYSKNVILAY